MKSDDSETEIIHSNIYSFYFQLVLLTIVLLAAFGNDGIRLTFGRADFLGVGISFCLAITLPLILIAYLCGGNLFVLVRCQYKLLCMSKTYKLVKYIVYTMLCAILPYFFTMPFLCQQMWAEFAALFEPYLLGIVMHSGSKWLKPAKTRWCQEIFQTSCVRFIQLPFPVVACTSYSKFVKLLQE